MDKGVEQYEAIIKEVWPAYGSLATDNFGQIQIVLNTRNVLSSAGFEPTSAQNLTWPVAVVYEENRFTPGMLFSRERKSNIEEFGRRMLLESVLAHYTHVELQQFVTPVGHAVILTDQSLAYPAKGERDYPLSGCNKKQLTGMKDFVNLVGLIYKLQQNAEFSQGVTGITATALAMGSLYGDSIEARR